MNKLKCKIVFIGKHGDIDDEYMYIKSSYNEHNVLPIQKTIMAVNGLARKTK